ncbi:hypothetical protein ACP70R_005667 [Stipagrostis hirtigluma subsp. patula]
MDADRRRNPGEDRISGLPDELLHTILLRLRSTRASARTSVLSHRWRHLWAGLPDLTLFSYGPGSPPPASFLDSVDAVLAASSAPAVDHLSIVRPTNCARVLASRVAPWLRFASQRVVGTLTAAFVAGTSSVPTTYAGGEEEIELPACDRATKINLRLENRWRLRPAAGLFTALTDLSIQYGTIDGGVLTALVSTQCPRLRDLSLSVALVAASDVSIISDSLRLMRFRVRKTRRLEVVASRLKNLYLHCDVEAHTISAPRLAEVFWRGYGAYDPRRHHFANVPRYLQVLQVSSNSIVASLLRQFDKVGELRLYVGIPQGKAEYRSFMNETKELPKCETL